MTQPKKIAPAPLSRPWRGAQRVFVEGLVVRCRVGVHDHERDKPQRVRIDIETERAEAPEGSDDKLRNVVCYEDLIERVKALVAVGHVNLVETMAETIADAILRDLPVERVRVRVCKLDVFDDAAMVGAEIERAVLEPAEPRPPELRAIGADAGEPE